MTTHVVSLVRHALMVGALITASLAGAACGLPFEVDTPAGFVSLDEADTDFDYRATSADGFVIGVRAIDNDREGSLEFWTAAIEKTLRNRGAYNLLGKDPIRSGNGVPGMRLRFGHDENGAPHRYDLAVFVKGPRIYVVDAGGTKKQFAEHEATVAQVMSSIQLD